MSAYGDAILVDAEKDERMSSGRYGCKRLNVIVHRSCPGHGTKTWHDKEVGRRGDFRVSLGQCRLLDIHVPNREEPSSSDTDSRKRVRCLIKRLGITKVIDR